jgi:FAD/FMN-containing dehydrogenase
VLGVEVFRPIRELRVLVEATLRLRPRPDEDRVVVARFEHLAEAGIPVSYTNVFWGGRSEIKPSEISPVEYAAWCERTGVDPDALRSS